jgi:hypothetical protein
MIDYWNKVMTRLKTALTGICSNISSSYNSAPSTFPALLVDEIGNTDEAIDLENTENAVTSLIDISAYSNKSLTEARKVMNATCDAMREMGFRRVFGPQQLLNTRDPSLWRITARFERIIADEDELLN